MKHFLIYLFRKIKANFIWFKLHNIFEPLGFLFLNIFYLSKFSKWKASVKQPEFNDFYNKKVFYGDRYKLYEHIFQKENLSSEIVYLEFGVSGGDSFKWWIGKNTNPGSKFFGFDTFSGLPENYGMYKSGEMSSSIPKVEDDRCKFIAGIFQETLPGFLKENIFEKKTVIHCDADLFSSTLFVLTSLAPYLKKDDIIFFDEFSVPTHEFKAFYDFVSAYGIKYELIGAINNYLQVAIKVSR